MFSDLSSKATVQVRNHLAPRFRARRDDGIAASVTLLPGTIRGDPVAIASEHGRSAAPTFEGRSWTSVVSSSGHGEAIMTPSPCSPARRSRGWTQPLA